MKNAHNAEKMVKTRPKMPGAVLNGHCFKITYSPTTLGLPPDREVGSSSQKPL
jgi:hypothetical protein